MLKSLKIRKKRKSFFFQFIFFGICDCPENEGRDRDKNEEHLRKEKYFSDPVVSVLINHVSLKIFNNFEKIREKNWNILKFFPEIRSNAFITASISSISNISQLIFRQLKVLLRNDLKIIFEQQLLTSQFRSKKVIGSSGIRTPDLWSAKVLSNPRGVFSVQFNMYVYMIKFEQWALVKICTYF